MSVGLASAGRFRVDALFQGPRQLISPSRDRRPIAGWSRPDVRSRVNSRRTKREIRRLLMPGRAVVMAGLSVLLWTSLSAPAGASDWWLQYSGRASGACMYMRANTIENLAEATCVN